MTTDFSSAHGAGTTDDSIIKYRKFGPLDAAELLKGKTVKYNPIPVF